MLLCLLPLAGGQALAGRLFVWMDNDAAKHYSDRAPIGLPYREIIVRPASGDARPGFETGIRESEYDLLKEAQREISKIDDVRQAAAKQREQHKSDCRQARIRYHEASHLPGARGSDYKSFLQKMNRACD